MCDADDYTVILSPWVRSWRNSLSWAAAVAFGLIFLAIVFRPDKPHLALLDLAIRIAFALWTIAVPAWFFVERVYGIAPSATSNPDFVKYKAELKDMQDAARAVWAGCAAALAVLLWKLGE